LSYGEDYKKGRPCNQEAVNASHDQSRRHEERIASTHSGAQNKLCGHEGGCQRQSPKKWGIAREHGDGANLHNSQYLFTVIINEESVDI
jgi:hypothetical protein